MPPSKRPNAADFGDILASFDRGVTDEAPSMVRHARQEEPDVEPETEAEPSRRPRPKNPLQRLLRNFSLPWPSGISGLIGGLAQHPPAPYAEEAAEVQAASPTDRPQRPEIASLEPTKTEDQTIADELGLSPELATVDLQRIRRDFAKKNHPDRFEPLRPAACQSLTC
jgi:hypothetical protein